MPKASVPTSRLERPQAMARPQLARNLLLLLVAAASSCARAGADVPAGLARAPPSPLPTGRPAELRLEDIKLPPGFKIQLFINESDVRGQAKRKPTPLPGVWPLHCCGGSRPAAAAVAPATAPAPAPPQLLPAAVHPRPHAGAGAGGRAGHRCVRVHRAAGRRVCGGGPARRQPPQHLPAAGGGERAEWHRV